MKTILFLLIISLKSYSFVSDQNSLNFPDSINLERIATQTLTFTNNSTLPASLNPVIDSNYFQIALNRCVNVLPNKKCQLTIRYNSQNIVGSYNSTLLFNGGSIQLSGRSVAQPLTQNLKVVSDLNFSVNSGVKRSEVKFIQITNQGSSSQPTITLNDSANFKIIVNRCLKILKTNETCSIGILYEPKSSNISSSLVIGSTSYPVNGQVISDVAPIGDNSTVSIEVEATRNLSFTQTLTSGNNLVWSLQNAPQGMSINNGSLNFTPSLSQIGLYSFQIKAQNQSGSFIRQIELKVKPYIEISSLNFSEGQVGNNLILIKFKSGVLLNRMLFDDIKSVIVPVLITKNGSMIDNYQRLSTNSTGNRIDLNSTPQTNFLEITLGGGISFSKNTNLSFSLQTSSGDFTYSYPVSISSNNKPYILYDIFAIKGDSVSGDSPLDIIINMEEFRRVSEGWRTPMITQFRVDSVSCQGTNLSNYYGGDKTVSDCLSPLASQSSETAFWFNQTFSDNAGETAIGGRALGLKHGVVIEKSPWFYTLAHEIGHNLGLYHTFESYGNVLPSGYPIAHKDSTDSSPVYRSLVWSVNRSFGNIVGDWLNYLIDYSQNLINFDFSTSDGSDTELDFYGAKLKTLSNPYEICFGLCYYPNDPFRNGDQVYLNYGSQNPFIGRSTGYACDQTGYNSTTKVWSVACSGSSSMTQNSVINVMSYWYKYNDSTSVFTTNQKKRIDATLAYPPFQYLGVRP